MTLKEFSKGDRVKVEESYYYNPLKGKKGIVRGFEGGNVGVEFGFDFPSGHEINGNAVNSDERGYYIEHKHLELIKVKPKGRLITTEYKAGMSITSYIRKLIKTSKDEERVKWLRTFDNCVLPERVRNMIEEALTIVLRSDMFEKWGINEHFEKGLTNSILIFGPPGTGKTMVSESIASVLGLNLMKLTNADIQSNIPGKTEKNITESFKKAKKENAVIMFDECDSMLYNRNSVGAILSAEINHLLGEIENFDGVCVFTTNRLHKLDEALQRRIIARIELPFPDEETRLLIWKKLIPKKMPIEKIDYFKLSKAELSGGEIKNAILLSARRAIAQNRKRVSINDFKIAVENLLKAKEDFEKVQPKRIPERIWKYADRGNGMDKIK